MALSENQIKKIIRGFLLELKRDIPVAIKFGVSQTAIGAGIHRRAQIIRDSNLRNL